MKTETQQPTGKLERVAATVSVDRAAQILGMSRRTVQYMLVDGRLRGTRTVPRGWWRVSTASLGELIANSVPKRVDKTVARRPRKQYRAPKRSGPRPALNHDGSGLAGNSQQQPGSATRNGG